MAPSEAPLLVWILSLNRDYVKEEYDASYELMKEVRPQLEIEYNPENADSFRIILGAMLPILMMRHRRVSRLKWRDCVTSTGKHWIEQTPDDMPPEKFLYSMIGYHVAYEGSMIGMAMTQGRQKQVINIGLGAKRIHVEPPGVSVKAYAESLAHKLTPLEQSFVKPEFGDETVLNRLCILLALKSAYIKAIGQPVGFDWRRLQFDIPGKAAMGDEHPLMGWEFRVFKTMLGVQRADAIVEEAYQCATAYFRGTEESSFVFHDNIKDIESWVQYLTIDQLMKVIPKLTA